VFGPWLSALLPLRERERERLGPGEVKEAGVAYGEVEEFAC